MNEALRNNDGRRVGRIIDLRGEVVDDPSTSGAGHNGDLRFELIDGIAWVVEWRGTEERRRWQVKHLLYIAWA